MNQTHIPEFMEGYYRESNNTGRERIERLAGTYSEERAVFLQTVFVSKQEFLRDWNKLTGQKKQLTADEALAPIREKYAEQAKRIAQEHSYAQDVEKPKPKEEQKPKDEQLGFDFKADTQSFLANLESMRKRTMSNQIRPR